MNVKQKKSDQTISFKKVGIVDVDQFFEKCLQLFNSINDIKAPLEDKRDSFFNETGFWKVPTAGNFHILIFYFRTQACLIGNVNFFFFSIKCKFTYCNSFYRETYNH